MKRFLIFALLCISMMLWAPMGQCENVATDLTESIQFGAKRLDFKLGDHKAFLIFPTALPRPMRVHPWVWYAPTFIGGHPDSSHTWYFKKILAQGYYIGGIEVGESHGNPEGRAVYQKYYEYITANYPLNRKACLLPQSRGGLMLYNWAVEHPGAVACIAGIYTVCNFTSYPGLEQAALAYGLTTTELDEQRAKHNPIDRMEKLAKFDIPIFHIHGDSDTVVPVSVNAGTLVNRYKDFGAKEATLKIVPGKGHEVCKEFFQDQDFLDFILTWGRRRMIYPNEIKDTHSQVPQPIPYRLVQGPEIDESEVHTYSIESPYINGPCRVRVLKPDKVSNRLLFVLPVTPWPGFEDKWQRHGDGLTEIMKLDLHNQYGYTVIAPDFPEHMPWYVDHESDEKRHHESYMMKVLVPFVDDLLDIKEPVRDLVGFSKSGFGALRLLLEYPETFHACSIWDPGAITRSYDAEAVGSLSDATGNEAHFEQCKIQQSIQKQQGHFRNEKRIAISGYSNTKFHNNLNVLHETLNLAGIPHSYDDSVTVEHHWFTGWLAGALGKLDEITCR